MFFGSIPALVTPFAAGRVDEAAFRDLVEWQIDEGSNGLVPCGTTGEAATLSIEEHRRVIEIAVEVARGRVPVIAGCGSNNTAHAIELTRIAKAGRRRRRAARAALLQPAEPGGDLRPSVRRRRARDSGHPLQCTVKDDHRHIGGNHGTAVAASQCHRRQGRDRQPGAGLGAAARLRRAVRPALGQ